VALTVLAVGVMLTMVMFAARSGPQRIFAGPLHDPEFRGVNPSYTPPAAPQGNGAFRDNGYFHGDGFFRVVGIILEVAFAACVLWLLYRGALRLYEQLQYLRRRPKKRKDPGPVDFDVLDDPEPLREALRHGVDEQFALLLGGTPRNAIVACWDRFEDCAERVGASRKHWETSSEFTLRLLDSVSADDAAVSRLEALYREARFSEHVIDESRRESAIEALRAIHASLGIGATSS
jgi:Domain of unknown function (DUF4129)